MKSKLKDNLAIKIISVLAAVFLWIYIQMVQNPEIEFTFTNMPVSLVNSSLLEERNLTVIDDTQFKTNVTVKCPRWTLNELDNEDFVAYVDLSEVRSEGTMELPIKVSINNDRIIKSGNEPSTINIRIDKIITVERDLQIHLTGKLKDSFYTSENLITPDKQKVSIKGPQSILERVNRGIISVDLSNRDNSFSDFYEVILTDSEGTAVADERLTILNDNVNVDVTVYEKKILPIKLANVPENIKYDITPPNVEIAGPSDIIKDMEEITVNNFWLGSSAVGYKQDINIVLDKKLLLLTDVKPQLEVVEDE